MKLIDKEICTACGNCVQFCPKHAIEMKKDRWNNLYPVIDDSVCIDCGLCNEVCHAMHDINTSDIRKCLAAYSNDEKIRHNAASGGIASALYSYAINAGYICAGTYIDENHEVHFKLFDTIADIESVQNSKYSFSFLDSVIPEIILMLKELKKVLFIGLPCQVAAVRQAVAVRKVNSDNLFCVDLICHGVPSADYLKEHIDSIDALVDVQSIVFRDPDFETSKYMFTLKDSEGKKYSKKVESNDNYQLFYHSATFNRDNCYNCRFANVHRVGDLTLGDFPSLGKLAPCNLDVRSVINKGISCILVNTDKGQSFVDALVDEDLIACIERPLEEALNYESQLNHPSIPPSQHDEFFEVYPQKGFSRTCNDIFRKEKIVNPMKRFVKDAIKNILGR